MKSKNHVTVQYDLSPADVESAIRHKLIELGWSPPKTSTLAVDCEKLLDALHQISLCSQNSMSSQRQCGEIARAAIAAYEKN